MPPPICGASYGESISIDKGDVSERSERDTDRRSSTPTGMVPARLEPTNEASMSDSSKMVERRASRGAALIRFEKEVF